jgi:hypothetical protein
MIYVVSENPVVPVIPVIPVPVVLGWNTPSWQVLNQYSRDINWDHKTKNLVSH